MKRLVFAFAAFGMGLASTDAFAFSDVQGTIRSLDWTTRQLVLDDGTSFSVQRGINMGKFKAGEKVTLRIEDERGVNIVTKLTKADHIDESRPKRNGPIGLGRVL